MRVKSNLQGRAVVLINLDELLPQQGLHAPDAIPLITMRYGFIQAPSLSDSIQKFREDGFKFEAGKLAPAGQELAIQDFTIWPDGVVVNAYTTQGAETFIDDFLTWGKEMFGFRATPAALTKRIYLSQLVIEFDYSIASKLLTLHPIFNAFNEVLQKTYGEELPPTEITTMRFDYDHAVAPLAFRVLSHFVLERRENHRFAEDNVFFSQAPLRTEDHANLLEDFERLLSVPTAL